MRWLGIIMATFGGVAVVVNLMVGGARGLYVWGAVCIVGVILALKTR